MNLLPAATPTLAHADDALVLIDDGHGSVRFLMDKTGAVTDRYDYDAFGNLINQTGTTLNNYLFVGEQFDPALGIYYNRARYYDERQGRFWSMDSFEGDLQSPASLHKYLYASANPINRIDPSGRADWSLPGLTTALGNALNIAGQAVLNYSRIIYGFALVLVPQVPYLIDKANYYFTWATAVLFAADKTLLGIGKLVQNLANYSGSDFPKGLPDRPDAIENCSGCNLGRRFPAFDNWEAETGEATQQFTTSQVSSPDAFLSAVRAKLNRWQTVYDKYDTFTGEGRDGGVVTFEKTAIQTKNLHVVTPVISNWKLQQIGQRLQQLSSEFEMEEIVVQESRFFKP